jgi:hypothetical protein
VGVFPANQHQIIHFMSTPLFHCFTGLAKNTDIIESFNRIQVFLRDSQTKVNVSSGLDSELICVAWVGCGSSLVERVETACIQKLDRTFGFHSDSCIIHSSEYRTEIFHTSPPDLSRFSRYFVSFPSLSRVLHYSSNLS